MKQTGLEFTPDSLRFDYSASKQQLVTLLLDNGSMRDGIEPKDVGWAYDENGQQDLCRIQTPPECQARKTDPSGKLQELAKLFLTGLASYADPSRTRVSISVAGGDNAVQVSALTGPNRPTDHYTTDLEGAKADLEKLSKPTSRQGYSNIYQGIQRIIQTDMGLEKYKDFEKFLLVITDGPNEVWDKDATSQKVLEELQKHNIHLFVLHYDNDRTTTTLRDPLTYWAGSESCRMNAACKTAPACTADTDCLSFEECRTVKLYAQTKGDPVTQTNEKHCIPKYREDGRLGPNNAYADMTCRTGGNYFYFSDADASEQLMNDFPAALDGQWSAEADLSRLDPMQIAVGFYRYSGSVLGLLGNQASATVFSTETYDPTSIRPEIPVQRETRPLMRVGVVDRGAKDR